MRVTLAQTSPKLNRSNLQEVLRIIQQVKNDSDLIVFPELALSGYMLQDKLFEDAWEEEELFLLVQESIDVDIAVGAALRDGKVFRNTALYFSQGKLISKHIKVHLPNYGMFEEERYFEGGDTFEAFEVDGQQLCLLVCEDLWHQEVHTKLVGLNPDMIIVLVASPARGFRDEGLLIEEKWHKIIKTVAKECKAKLIFVNRVGFEDGLGFWGGSCVIDENSNIIEQLSHFDITIKTISI